MVEGEGIVREERASMGEEETQAVTWEQVKMAAGVDRTCRELVRVIREGFPGKKDIISADNSGPYKKMIPIGTR